MTCKVFLVDDEIAIREGIRNAALWNDGAFTLVGEAPDGEVALPMLQDERPDILLTDIRMPFMDGMELAREVSRLMPWVEIVILSGYDDFNYAREAMSLGVKEYLLKPVSAKDLRKALEQAAERIEQARRSRESLELLRRRLTGSNRFLKEKLLLSALTEPADEAGARNMLEQTRALGINLVARCYAVADITFDFGPAGDLHTGQDLLYALAEGSGGIVQVCAGRHGTLALVLGDSEADTEERLYAFARSALGELERGGCVSALVAVGEAVTDFSQAVHSAQTARHVRHVLRARLPAMTGMQIVSTKDLQDGDAPHIPPNIRPLYETMQYAPLEDVENILRTYAASLGGTEIHSAVAADYLHVETLMTATRIVRDAGGDPQQVLDLENYEKRLLTASREGENDLPSASALMRQAAAYRDAHGSGQGSAPVARARAYLAQHFSEPELMLQDVSAHVGMSNSRFSTVFAQKTGMTFTDYLTALRVGKARELLRATAMRSSEIAYAVGYNDPHYFSYLFKKSTGLTPSEYRKTEEE